MKNLLPKVKRNLAIFGFILVLIIFLMPLVGEAADTTTDSTTNPYQYREPNVELQVPLFGYTNASNIAEYIGKIYAVALWIIVPILIVMIIFGGLLWIISAGDNKLISTGKDYIKNSLIGLGIVLGSYVLLSLVGITQISSPQVATIKGEDIPAMQDLIIINGVEMTLDQAMAYLPPERRGNVNDFNNSGCPTGKTSFPVFFTNYYTPEYGDKGSYMPSFWCNIAMQCSCPLGRDKGASCGLKNFAGGYTPCKQFSASTPYCNKTSSGRPPVGNYTIAGSTCFKPGCKFTIQGAPNTYEIMDRGSAIKGTHMDLYVGKGRSNLNAIAGVYTITLQNPGQCFQ